MEEGVKLKLSPSSLSVMRACPRCFWLQMNGPKEPAGFPMAILNVFDAVEKNYYDKYRKEGLPPMLKGKIPLKLVDQKTAEKLRKYLIWEDTETGAVLRGKMDDCFIDNKGTLVVMDNKTRSGDFKEIYENYLFQLDTYAFLLEKNGYKVADKGYIIYFQPDKGSDLDKGVKFSTDPKVVKLNPNRVIGVFREAVKIAKQKKAPEHHKECETCLWINKIRELEL
ncbi:MAG: PD-(D/E)XK nuclease family protein [Candidatus Pacearchaeota archaeon]|nr:PD-(D/E)XK nuclease family protein [Candidatus Pacearchaeota archaeon]